MPQKHTSTLPLMLYAFVAFTGATHSQEHYSAQEIHRRIAAARHLNQPPPLYKEKTFGHCDANGDGWTPVTSVAACEAGAVALGWGDTTADTTLLSNKPSGCYRNYATLNFNPDNSNGVACDWNQKCLCTFVCPPGSYQDPLGEALCTTCSNGTYSTAGASSCPFDATSCPRGTYASGSTTVCNACGIGQYNDQVNQTTEAVACQYCHAGEYQNEEGQHSCKTCPSGTYTNSDGASNCFGMYIALTSGTCDDSGGGGGGGWDIISSVAACETGAAAFGWSDTTAYIVSSLDFPPGCFSFSSGLILWFNTAKTNVFLCNSDTNCLCTLVCLPGTYQDQLGETSCKACGNGAYSTASASSCPYSATSCPPGTYASGTAECESCNTGKYNDLPGQTSVAGCKGCGLGKYNDQTSQSRCKECSTGTFNNQTSATGCKECSTGKYNEETNQSSVASCKECKTGRYNDQTSVSDCKECPTGQYNDQTSAMGCKECGTGKYNDQTSQTSVANCKKCTTGHYNAQASQSKCKECSIGTYNEELSSVRCKPCNTGKYMDQSGASACISCALGKYNDEKGKSSEEHHCEYCGEGKYNDQLSAASCKLCGAGKYNDQYGQTSEPEACKHCGMGKYSDRLGQLSEAGCQLCKTGSHVSADSVTCNENAVCSHTNGWFISTLPTKVNATSCACGTTYCDELSGMYCSAKASLCSSRPIQCGSTFDSLDYEKCQVVTDRCGCSKCIPGFHTTICIPCTFCCCCGCFVLLF